MFASWASSPVAIRLTLEPFSTTIFIDWLEQTVSPASWKTSLFLREAIPQLAAMLTISAAWNWCFAKSNMKLFWIFSRFSSPEEEPEAKSSCYHKQQTLWLPMGLTAESKQHRFVQRYVTEPSIKQESLSKNSWQKTSNFTQLVPHPPFLQRTEQIQGKIRPSNINKRKSPAEKYLEIVDAKASKKLFPSLSSCNSWKPLKCPFVPSIYQWVFRLHLEHKI